MNLLQKYVFRRFIANFLGANFLFIFLFIITKYAEQVDQFLKVSDQTPMLEFIYYFLYEIPYSSTYVYPMATMFSVVYMLGKLNEQNELYMLYSTGKSIWYYLYPIIIFLFIFCIIFAVFNEEIVYHPHQKHRSLHAKFRNQEYMQYSDLSHLVQFGTDDKLYVINYYNHKAKTMSNVKIFFITEETKRFDNIIMADTVKNIDETFWEIFNPRYYHLLQDRVKFNVGNNVISNLGDKPFYFNEVLNAEDMSTAQVRAEAEKLEIIGGNHKALWTEYYLKTAIPFIPIIIFLLGVPMSIFTKRSVTVLSFVFSIMGAFVYLVFLNVGVSLGKSGILHPFLAGWLGNITFLVVSGIAYWRLKI